MSDLEAIGLREFVADFHCVTTWSVKGVTWTGVPLLEIFASLGIEADTNQYVVAVGSDHRRATFVWEDAVAPDVLLATQLNGVPLGARHGGPVRLVAPQQYGYKSVKHLLHIDLRPTAPNGLGKEHLRGRVALEERHPKLSSWVVRLPYRLLIAPTAAIAERTLGYEPTPVASNEQKGTRLPNAQHTSPHWIINKIAFDFTLEDAWSLPGVGGPDDFGALLDVVAQRDRADTDSKLALVLFQIRERMGSWFGWDKDRVRAIPGCNETSLADRLPIALRGTAAAAQRSSSIFVPVFRTANEYAAEVSNGTVHAALHLAWVEQGNGRYRGEMGVYVKPRGLLGTAYTAAIRPFRHRIIYPAMMRQLERARSAQSHASASAGSSN